MLCWTFLGVTSFGKSAQARSKRNLLIIRRTLRGIRKILYTNQKDNANEQKQWHLVLNFSLFFGKKIRYFNFHSIRFADIRFGADPFKKFF